MSMFIKGINPPKSCYTCDWYNKVQCQVDVSKCYYKMARHPSCPLIEVPPHGRLIDVDELGDRMHGKWTIYDYEALGKSPTVIEAER